MKKILLGLLVTGAVGGVALLATNAFFSDTETSTGNVFQAGAIDLKIDNTSYATDPKTGLLAASENTSWDLSDLTVQKFFNFTDLKPGDVGEDTISVHVNNNDAWLCAAARVTVNSDETCTEPESSDDQCVVETDGQNGDLAQAVNFAFWKDDGDNVLEDGETPFLSGPISGLNNAGQIALADTSANSVFGPSTPIPGDTTVYIGKAWCFGTLTPAPLPNDREDPNPELNNPVNRGTGFTCNGALVNNATQTDKVVGDLQFYAVQSRNNANFTCAQNYTPTWGEVVQGPVVGAVLADYVAPTVCTDTVSGAESIQASEDAAAPGATICVDPTYDRTGDNTRILIDTVGLTLAATVQGVDLDVPVTLSASNVTVTGFDGVIGQAATPAEKAAFYAEGDADLFEISFNSVTGGVGAAILTESGGVLGGGLIANNVLNGATQGIYTNPHTGTITIEYNDIDNNAAGIGGLVGATVRYNEFEHSGVTQEAIGVDSTHDANPATVSNNNFLNGTKLNTYGPIAGDVSAENNFWGPSGGATQTGGTGEVDFTPETVVAYPHNI
jgi:predicted ribosomally synthesized peptide with SipW-like signal peptide